MRKNSFYLLILALLILLFPLPTFAFSIVSAFRDVLLLLPTVGIAIVFGFFILVSGLAVWLTAAILNWVTSPGFISLSYTRPSNPIIEMGLSITQSFVNLALVIILVVIALFIALRLGEYGSKKIFAKLIVIALLVNFAPVLVGLIVDASNIVMHFFLDAIGEGAADIGAQVVNYSSGLWKTMWQAGGSIVERTGLVMQGVTQIIVNVSMAIAFFLFAVLFLARYVVIWVLTILSPLAFVAWILPGTKKFWTMWWNQLIQWSIVGIPIAFFLYLAMNSFALLRTAFVSKLQMVGAEPATVGFLNDIFPYFVIIIFLYLGFTVGLKTGAMGADIAIRGFQAAHKTAQKETLKRLGRGAGVASGVPLVAKGVAKEVGRIQRTYEIGRGFGLSRPRAAGEAAGESIKRYWQKRAKPALETVITKEGREKAVGKAKEAIKIMAKTAKETVTTKGVKKALEKAGDITMAAGRGTWSAVRDVSTAAAKKGWAAAVKPPKEKKTRKLTEEEKKKIQGGIEVEVETPEEG